MFSGTFLLIVKPIHFILYRAFAIACSRPRPMVTLADAQFLTYPVHLEN